MAESIDRVIIEYGIEITKLKADLEKVKAELGLVGAAGKQATDETQKGFDGVGKAAKKGTGEAKQGFFSLDKVIKSQLNPIKALKGALMGLGIAGIATMTAMLVGQLVKMGKEFFAASKEAIAAEERLKRFAEAQKEIAIGVETERVKITQLLLVARDEKRSKEDKLGAVKALIKISPEHFGILKLETIHLNATTAAIDAYINSAEKRITIKVNEAQIYELIKNRIEQEEKLLTLQNSLLYVNEQKALGSEAEIVVNQTTLTSAKNRVKEQEKLLLGTVNEIDQLVDLNATLFDAADANVAVVGSTRELEEKLKQLKETQGDLVRGTPEYAAGLIEIARLDDILNPKIKEQKEAVVGLIGTLKDEIATLKEQVLVETDILKLRELQSKIVTKEAALEVLEDPAAAAAKLAAINKQIASDELATTIEQTKTTFDAQDLLIKENYATLLTDQTLSEEERKNLTAGYDAALLLSNKQRLAQELQDLKDYQLSVEGLDGQIQDKTLEIKEFTADGIIKISEETNATILKSAEETAAEEQRLREQITQSAIQLGNELFDFQQALYDREIVEIERLRDTRVITEEDAAQQIGAIRRKQAVSEKAQAISQAIIQTALAALQINANLAVNADVTQTLRTILTALVVGIGMAQLAIIAAQPIPSFAEGTEYLQGKGTGTSDSIAVMASRGERITPADENAKHFDILSAIHNGNLEDYILQSYLPQLMKKGSLAENLSASMGFDDNGIRYDLGKLMRYGNKNTKALIEALQTRKSRRREW